MLVTIASALSRRPPPHLSGSQSTERASAGLVFLLTQHLPCFQIHRIGRTRESNAVTDKSEEATVPKANLVEHLKNIDTACDDARLSAVEKIRRIKEEVEKACAVMRKIASASAANAAYQSQGVRAAHNVYYCSRYLVPSLRNHPGL